MPSVNWPSNRPADINVFRRLFYGTFVKGLKGNGDELIYNGRYGPSIDTDLIVDSFNGTLLYGGWGFDSNLGRLTSLIDTAGLRNNLLDTNNVSVDSFFDISAGDYLLIDSDEKPGDGVNTLHGLLVVGWGEVQDCPTAMGSFDENLDGGTITIPSALQLSVKVPTRSDPLYVPYVVDFTGPRGQIDGNVPGEPYRIIIGQEERDYLRAQRGLPRPFYCTWYTERVAANDIAVNPPPSGTSPVGIGTRINVSRFFGDDLALVGTASVDRLNPETNIRHDWYFFPLPDFVIIPTTHENSAIADITDQLYQPDWSWINTDGMPPDLAAPIDFVPEPTIVIPG